MYLLPTERGKGVIQQIIETLQVWCVGKGVHEFVLQVYAENARAIRAYEKVGFIPHVTEMRMSLG